MFSSRWRRRQSMIFCTGSVVAGSTISPTPSRKVYVLIERREVCPRRPGTPGGGRAETRIKGCLPVLPIVTARGRGFRSGRPVRWHMRRPTSLWWHMQRPISLMTRETTDQARGTFKVAHNYRPVQWHTERPTSLVAHATTDQSDGTRNDRPVW